MPFFYRLILCLIASSLLASCAANPKRTSHQFSFDGQFDGWEQSVDLLEYDYGGQNEMTRNSVTKPRSPAFDGLKKLPVQSNVNGPMAIGEFLFVKWRLLRNGKTYEQFVNLKERLPNDMTGQGLTFVISDEQLYVYVVTRKPQDSQRARPQTRTWYSGSFFTYEIFPKLKSN